MKETTMLTQHHIDHNFLPIMPKLHSSPLEPQIKIHVRDKPTTMKYNLPRNLDEVKIYKSIIGLNPRYWKIKSILPYGIILNISFHDNQKMKQTNYAHKSSKQYQNVN